MVSSGLRGNSASWWPERRFPRGRENDGAGGRAESQGSGSQPQGHARRAGICVFWKRLAARSLERTLSRAQLGPEAELTLPKWESGRLAGGDEHRETRATGKGGDMATSGKHGRVGHSFTEKQKAAFLETPVAPVWLWKGFSRWGASREQPDHQLADRIPQGSLPGAAFPLQGHHHAGPLGTWPSLSIADTPGVS